MTAREALGMPVPPVAAVKAVSRVRRGMAALDLRMGTPFQVVLDRAFGILDTKTLSTVVMLGVPEALADGPMTSAEVAARVGADADALERVLRYLSSRGVFKRRRRGRWANNSASNLLRADHPYSWRDWAVFMGASWNTSIWDSFEVRVRGAGTACEAAHGQAFFDYVNSHPDAAAAFNGSQAAGSRVQGAIFAEHVDFDGVSTVCDVGGGSGSVLTAVLRAHPAASGVVLDLPALESAAAAVFEGGGVAARAGFVGGDFFSSVPGGFDLYTLFAVVHDWGDDECVSILGNVRAALKPGARVMVVEGHLPKHAGADFIKAADMLMLAYSAAGRERTLGEFDALFRRAGLVQRRRVTLPSLFDVFELVPG